LTTEPDRLLRAGRHVLDFSDGIVHLMGVLNLSPESKNAATVAGSVDEALAIAERHRHDGASIIDVGAQSSHFENVELSAHEELDRVSEAVDRLVSDGHCVSVDTWKPEVARGVMQLGASLINDTGGLRHHEMIEAVAAGGAAAVLMYLEGESPLAVGEMDFQGSAVNRMVEHLGRQVEVLAEKGITNLVVDPGIGISYRGDRARYTEHQLDVVRRLDRFRSLGKPVLVPVPRKPSLSPTLAFATLALEYGADLLRVHDVDPVAEIARLMGRME
jgi:dihydropteroate synthase